MQKHGHSQFPQDSQEDWHKAAKKAFAERDEAKRKHKMAETQVAKLQVQYAEALSEAVANGLVWDEVVRLDDFVLNELDDLFCRAESDDKTILRIDGPAEFIRALRKLGMALLDESTYRDKAKGLFYGFRGAGIYLDNHLADLAPRGDSKASIAGARIRIYARDFFTEQPSAWMSVRKANRSCVQDITGKPINNPSPSDEMLQMLCSNIEARVVAAGPLKDLIEKSDHPGPWQEVVLRWEMPADETTALIDGLSRDGTPVAKWASNKLDGIAENLAFKLVEQIVACDPYALSMIYAIPCHAPERLKAGYIIGFSVVSEKAIRAEGAEVAKTRSRK